MKNIAIISSSIRPSRKSHRVVLYFKNYIKAHKLAKVDIIDLMDYNFPLFAETYKEQTKPIPLLKKYVNQINKADGIIIVSPEYNAGIPASLKNAIDVLLAEWKDKPVAIATVSAGPFGGTQCLTALQFCFWKIKALTITEQFCVAHVDKNYDEDGNPADRQLIDKLAKPFVDALLKNIP